MERKVLKFLLPLTAEGGPEVDTPCLEVVMPAGAEIMTARMVEGRAAVWAVVNTERKKMLRLFQLVGDSAPMREAAMGKYVDTLAFLGGGYLLHLFDLGEREWVTPKR